MNMPRPPNKNNPMHCGKHMRINQSKDGVPTQYKCSVCNKTITASGRTQKGPAPSGKAKTNAERQQAWRDRQKLKK